MSGAGAILVNLESKIKVYRKYHWDDIHIHDLEVGQIAYFIKDRRVGKVLSIEQLEDSELTCELFKVTFDALDLETMISDNANIIVINKSKLHYYFKRQKEFFKQVYGRKLTMSYLGELLDRDKSTISQWLNDTSPNLPSLQNFKRLCLILQVDPNELLDIKVEE